MIFRLSTFALLQPKLHYRRRVGFLRQAIRCELPAPLTRFLTMLHGFVLQRSCECLTGIIPGQQSDQLREAHVGWTHSSPLACIQRLVPIVTCAYSL